MTESHWTRRSRRWLLLLIPVLLIIALLKSAGLIQDWIWMTQVGYGEVFQRILSIKLVVAAAAFIVAFLFLWINLQFALAGILRLSAHIPESNVLQMKQGVQLSPGISRAAVMLVSAALGIGFAVAFYARWDVFLRYHWGGAFGQSDPVFGRDIGFYLFSLPLYEVLQNAFSGLTFLALVGAGISYAQFGLLQPVVLQTRPTDRRISWHLSFLLLFFMAGWIWGLYLDRFELLYSTRGVVYGVGYTAFHVERIGLWIMLTAAVCLGVFVLICMLKRQVIPVLIGTAGYFVLYFLILVLLPGVVQKYKVQPNELQLETPFLMNNIAFTRQAFQLDRITEKAYPAMSELTNRDIESHQDTIRNIRLWDWRPILQTYRQTQEIRLYYEFYSVDVDRYHLGEGYRQVMLSARQLASELPEKAQTWVNQNLQFTHGYGLVMSFVSKQAEGGLPVYALQDIPPESEYGLKVGQPAIYYGEEMPGYRIVATQIKEFDYPKGNDNVYTQYDGKGGIPLNGFWKKSLFAWTQSDINILLTGYLTPESRIQIYRDIQTRVSKIAPFLRLDQDPYLVLVDGRLCWVQDAYTQSDRYPYAQPSALSRTRTSYIRNAAKVVVDAYDGTVHFYVADTADPVLGLYRRAFPNMFEPLESMPAGLKSHLRYPEDLFRIQADAYMNYHMTDPQVFYNQEDLWSLPDEKYAGQAVQFQPYYILMRLPDTKKLEYFLMTPFTPRKRDNMIAWMGANCDGDDYGKIIVYQLPKERLTFGPIQIEAMIDQNAVISEQLSLWDQRGSQVIRGNLVVIPIDNAFLYVEPVYLLAEGVNIPQLIRVIVISGSKVAMAPTLDQAIGEVFGTAAPSSQAQAGAPASIPAPVADEALIRAGQQLEDAQKALREGSWEEFGKQMDQLKQMLKSNQAGEDK